MMKRGALSIYGYWKILHLYVILRRRIRRAEYGYHDKRKYFEGGSRKMLGAGGFWLYVFIFVGKVVEVAFDTLRIMFVGKGKRVYGVICGFASIMLWIVLVSSVLSDISEDPFKAVVYCVAYAGGIYLGATLEGWLAVGLTSVQIVLKSSAAEELGARLRSEGFGVTILEGHSVSGLARELIFVQLRRKRVPEAIRIVNDMCSDAVISVSDVRYVRGGFLR